jgi:hypothetical protein
LHARDLWDRATLPMTQELLARLIGVQRNAISIVAHALQTGIIRYSCGRIEIMNDQALQGDRVRMSWHRQGKTRAIARRGALTRNDDIHPIAPCDSQP